MEIAIANGDFDVFDNKWTSPEVQADYARQFPRECPCPGAAKFDPYGTGRKRKLP